LFIESIKTLDLPQIEQILQKETQDLVKGISPINKVIEVIKTRETLLRDINTLTELNKDNF